VITQNTNSTLPVCNEADALYLHTAPLQVLMKGTGRHEMIGGKNLAGLMVLDSSSGSVPDFFFDL
jgi:hypothetical protein